MSLYSDAPYYLDAFGIAAKRGFEGGVDEWLDSLRGARVEIRYENDAWEWKHENEGDDAWREVVSFAEMVSDIEDAVKAAEKAAEDAEESALNASEIAGGDIASASQLKKLEKEVHDGLAGKASLINGLVPKSQIPELDYIPTSEKGVPDGVASLDDGGKVPVGQVPELDYVQVSEKGEPDGVASLDSDGLVYKEQLPALQRNPNLLIDGWLRNWPEGAAFVNPNNKYTSALIKCSGTGAVNRMTDYGGMIITGTITLRYIFENIIFAGIDGKTVTLSYSKNGEVETETYVANSTNCPVDGQGRRAFLLTLSNCTLEWIKLEEGDKATTIEQNTDFDVLRITRYFSILTLSGGIGVGRAGSAGSIYVNIGLPNDFRVTPTMTISGNLIFVNIANNALTDIIPTSVVNNPILLVFEAISSLANLRGIVIASTTRTLTLDARL